jgi:hypothetical protein
MGKWGTSLPARSCSLILIGEVLSGKSHLAKNRHLVYSSYAIAVKQILKGKNEAPPEQLRQVEALQFGGAIRFPSGHVEFFIRKGGGFLGTRQKYLLFLWKSIRGMDDYDIGPAYLLGEDGIVYATDEAATFREMPTAAFEAKVNSAIKANVNR